MRYISVVVMAVLTLGAGCSKSNDAQSSPDTVTDTPDTNTNKPPLELTPELCNDPNNMAALMDSMSADDSSGPTYGKVNNEQVLRMLKDPTAGPFYMVNLIRFREQAQYPDGRESSLTGKEANALYSPVEFLAAIGASIVFAGDVAETSAGAKGTWDQVAIVKYPCPLALFAMTAHPEFQARSVHKDAGVEASIVMVTHLQDLDSAQPTESPFPATADDPAFELVRVNSYRENAQYAEDANEPGRTGQAAMDRYISGIHEAKQQLGIYPKAHLKVQGVFIGDERKWNEVWIDVVPSKAAHNALAETPAVAKAQHHLEAALADSYGLVTYPMLSNFWDNGDGPGMPAPPITADGTGTLCSADSDCPGNGVDKCFIPNGTAGFCSREGCGVGDCEAPYVCCRECSELVVSLLPFEGSICLPNTVITQLTASPALCTCD